MEVGHGAIGVADLWGVRVSIWWPQQVLKLVLQGVEDFILILSLAQVAEAAVLHVAKPTQELLRIKNGGGYN